MDGLLRDDLEDRLITTGLQTRKAQVLSKIQMRHRLTLNISQYKIIELRRRLLIFHQSHTDAHERLSRLCAVRSVVNSQKHDQVIAVLELKRSRRTDQLLSMKKDVRKLRRIRRQRARRL